MKRDTKIGLILFVFSVLFLIVIIPNFIEVDTALASPIEKLIGPRFFATFLGVFLTILSLVLIFAPLLKKEVEDAPKMELPVKLRVIGVIVISIFYILLMSFAGYIVATFLALAGLLWLFGVRKIQALVGNAFIFTLSLYIIFGKLLMVLLP